MDAFLGTILMWPGNFAPANWAYCDGRILSIHAGNEALFTIIGTQFGGNGVSTFQLPDLRGRTAIGPNGQNPLTNRIVGAFGGQEQATGTGTGSTNVTLTSAHLPAHNHTATLSLAGLTANTQISVGTAITGGQLLASTGATLSSTTGGVPGAAAIYLPAATPQTAPVTLGGVTTTVGGSGSVDIASSGTGSSFPVSVNVAVTTPTLSPYLVLNYIICLSGIYPSRG